MKHVAQNYRSGELAVIDVPQPACKAGGVLVRTLFSLISTGTEMMKVAEASKSLVAMARARPDQVRKVLDSVAQQGAVATYHKAMNRLDSYTPLGYSLSGVVIEVGAGVTEFAVGDVVAAAGNEYALHAEVNWVPVNLCVRVPDGIAPEHAAFATVGAIAMQGVRRSEVQLGETACVIGLGLVGQLLVRLLLASGVRVVGVDTVESRCRMAEKAGAVACAGPDADGVAVVEQALARCGGGADHVFLAAGGNTNGPVELAARLARDRARVVDIGKTRLDLPWNAYYEKELDVRFSRSYGPGRYDPRYEVEGVDYPIGYVRWTERRNLECFLDLIASDSLEVASLVSAVHPIADAPSLYEELRTGARPGVGFLLEYAEGEGEGEVVETAVPRPRVATTLEPPSLPATRSASSDLRLGFVGAGNYATTMLLPHLARHAGVRMSVVATTRSLSAINAQRKFGFDRATTRADDVLEDPAVDAVLVVTRHHSHAALVCRALEAGKAVFVEKPLALDDDQLDRVLGTVERTGNDRLMVGFNRRFAPLFGDLSTWFGTGDGPMAARYLVNAGPLDPSSWYLDEGLEGSRFMGEGGHFVDTLAALIGHAPEEVHAVQTSSGADLQVTIRYADGSLGTITYTAGGHARFPKETLDVNGGGRSGRLDNFTRTSVWTPAGHHGRRAFAGKDKGQATMLDRFLDAVRQGTPMPIDLDSLATTTRATIAVAHSLAARGPVRL